MLKHNLPILGRTSKRGHFTMKSYLEDEIAKDMQKKMVFLSGLRQCGKATPAKQIIASYRYMKPTQILIQMESNPVYAIPAALSASLVIMGA